MWRRVIKSILVPLSVSFLSMIVWCIYLLFEMHNYLVFRCEAWFVRTFPQESHRMKVMFGIALFVLSAAWFIQLNSNPIIRTSQTNSSSVTISNHTAHLTTDEIMEKILQSPKLYSIINSNHNIETDQTSTTNELSEQIETIKTELVHLKSQIKSQLDHLEQLVSDRYFESGLIPDASIKLIIKSALKIYDADKTGLVDYAMKPLGGRIVTTRSTEIYHSGTESIFGIPMWYPSISPNVVIRPGIRPRECWGFRNFPGVIVIELADRIRIETFSLEHISRLMVPKGEIGSAPKEFEVYGLDEEDDQNPVKIGEYVYDQTSDCVQHFEVQEKMVFGMVEVRIKSNHGNPNYTCLYRFRVHGSADDLGQE